MALGKATGNQKLLRSHRCSESRDTSHYYVLLAVNFDAYALTALIRSQQNRMQLFFPSLLLLLLFKTERPRDRGAFPVGLNRKG